MPRRRGGRRRRGRGSTKIPIVSVGILAGQAALAMASPGSTGNTLLNALDNFASYYTGFQMSTRTFSPQLLAIGYAPWIAKRFIMPIARPRLPMRGLPISLS